MVGAELEIVIPIFNEIEIIEQLHRRVVAACRETGLSYRVIYVNDGSKDGTGEWIVKNAIREFSGFPQQQIFTHQDGNNRDIIRLCDQSPNMTPPGNVTLVELSRNFGQPSAIFAGLEASRKARQHQPSEQPCCVVIMDGDLQDPPELIPSMVDRWQAGDQVVIAERTSRQETFLRGIAFKLFHKCFRYLADSKIPPNTGTFCLLDRQAADSICSLSESHRFFPGLRAWVGYRQSMVAFERPPRAGGEPKQTFVRLTKYALDAIFGYSFKPLRLMTGIGVTVCSISFLCAVWFILKRMAGLETASIGFTTLTCAVFGLGGLQLIAMGVLGEYIGRIYDEVKRRPQYLIATQTQADELTSQSTNEKSTATSIRIAG